MAPSKKGSEKAVATKPATTAASARQRSMDDILELQRTRVVCGPDGNMYTSSSIGGAQYATGEGDGPASMERFARSGLQGTLPSRSRSKFDDTRI